MTGRDVSDAPASLDEVPCVTSDLPGTGGKIRICPEDFEVEEIPAYEPCGTGDHLFLWTEKRGRTTREVALEIARRLGADARDVGYAGLKDRNALTRQYFSVPASPSVLGKLLSLDNLPADAGFRVLSSARHGNKLKTGHLKGNRFRILIRDTVPDAPDRALAILAELAAAGLPNAFGAQRFGRDGMNAARGRALVLGEKTPETARLFRDRFLRRLCISAYQSLLFNRLLARRMADGLFQRAVPGDLMKKLDTGGLFISEDADADTHRMETFGIAPTGPLFGHRMMCPAGDALAREEAILAEEGIRLDSFRHLKGDAEGARRPLRIPVTASAAPGADEGTLRLDFALPKGSFATVLLREVMKTDAALPGLADED